jgi:adenylylsulfate kinase-like enzyme
MDKKIIWLYGMSGSGKTTLSKRLAYELSGRLFDGDVVRKTFEIEPKFDPISRRQYMDLLRTHLGTLQSTEKILIVAAITPYNDMRQKNRLLFGNNYYEVLIRCDINCLLKRDPKGLYKKALKGEISNFTGISDVFEEGYPDLVIDTTDVVEQESYSLLINNITYWLKECNHGKMQTTSC